MSTLALDGDDDFRLPKKKAEDALPRHKPETGRKYLAECEKLGFPCTVKTMGKRFAELTTTGQAVIASMLTRWMAELAKVRRAADLAAHTGSNSDLLNEIETGWLSRAASRNIQVERHATAHGARPHRLVLRAAKLKLSEVIRLDPSITLARTSQRGGLVDFAEPPRQ